MYCKSCGVENSETANYCINDGTLLKSYPVKYRKKEHTSAFCSSCGEVVSSQCNYCQNCGDSLMKYESKKTVIPKISSDYKRDVAPKLGKLPAFGLLNLKRAVIPALIAIFLFFVFSFSIKTTSEKLYNSLMNDAMNDYDINQLIDEINSNANLSIPKLDKLIGVTDILMWGNLQNPNVTFKTSGDLGFGAGSVSVDILTKNGFFIYLLIPFIGLFVAGIYAGRKTRGSDLLSRLADSVGIAIIYAFFCTIISLFAGFSYDAKIDQMGVNLSLDLETNYSFFKTLLMSFLFGFLFSSLGILFSTNFRKVTAHLSEVIPSGEAIHQAIAVPVRGILILFVISFVILMSKISEFKDKFSYELEGTPLAALIDKSFSLICSLALQLGTYVWNLLQFTSMTFSVESDNEKGSLAYHLFSGIKPEGQFGALEAQAIEEFFASSHVGMYLKFSLIIPIVLFLWAGIRIGKHTNLMKNLIVFSVLYAVIMMGIASFSDIGFSFGGNGDGETKKMFMMLGFSPFITFICSLVFSFVFAYAGAWIQTVRTKQ